MTGAVTIDEVPAGAGLQVGTGWVSGSCGTTRGVGRDGMYGGHEPRRTTWDCIAPGCGEAWPCPRVRRALIDSVTLRLCGQIMTGWMITAAGDLRMDSGDLFDRFLLWIWLLPVDRAVNEAPRAGHY